MARVPVHSTREQWLASAVEALPRLGHGSSTSARRCLCSIASGVIEGACGTPSATGWNLLVPRWCYTVILFLPCAGPIRRVANLVGAEAVLKLRMLRSPPRLRCVLGPPGRGSTSGTTPSDTLMG